jgi:hypothetical protein
MIEQESRKRQAIMEKDPPTVELRSQRTPVRVAPDVAAPGSSR